MTALHYAASRGLLWVVDRLGTRALIDELDFMHSTPLMHAAANGHLEVFELLVHHGASIIRIDGVGSCCLAKACDNGHLQVVRRCIEIGLPVESVDVHQLSPLWKACRHGDESIV